MEDHVILGVHVFDRMKKVPTVQTLLSEYGCNIKTRIGLHHVDENVCSPEGLILLELVGDRKLFDELAAKLAALGGVEVQKMVFGHP
jgi:hypothetical protein